jgi:uncharacterized protein (DUF1697 family)
VIPDDSTHYVALLRGINVGKAKPVAMAELRALVESLGFRDVRTLLRSGNVLFVGSRDDPRGIARSIETAIESRFDMGVGVVIRTAEELAAAVNANPIQEAAAEGSNLHVMFLAEPLAPAERKRLEPGEFEPDVVRLADREIYVWYRNGMSGSATAAQLARRIRTLMTDRNWNTVGKLHALMDAD